MNLILQYYGRLWPVSGSVEGLARAISNEKWRCDFELEDIIKRIILESGNSLDFVRPSSMLSLDVPVSGPKSRESLDSVPVEPIETSPPLEVESELPLLQRNESGPTVELDSSTSFPIVLGDASRRELFLQRLVDESRCPIGLIEKYLNDYFSSYSEEINGNDPEFFSLLLSLFKRIQNVEQAKKDILRFLDPENSLLAHQSLSENVLNILNKKIELDCCLQKIKLGNLQRNQGVGDRNKIKEALINHVNSVKSTNLLTAGSYSLSELEDFFSAFYVYPLSFGEKEQWAVIDMSRVDSKDRERTLKKFLTRSQIEKDLGFQSDTGEQKRKPGSIIFYELSGGLLKRCKDSNPKNGVIQVFYEERKEAAQSHDERKTGEGVRLETLSDSKEAEKLGLVKGDVYRRRSKFSKGQNGFSTQDEMRTAAVDRLEAIWTFRLMAKKILTQGIEGFDSNELLAINTYMLAIQSADLAGFSGSYLEDPVFIQTISQMSGIQSSLRGALAAKKSHDIWEKGLLLSKDTNLKYGVKAASEVIEMLRKWGDNIEKFEEILQKYPEAQLEFGWFSAQFKKIFDGIGPIISALNIPLESGETEQVKIGSFLDELKKNFVKLRPLVWELSLAYQAPLVKDLFLKRISEVESTSFELLNAVNTAFPYSYQFPLRVMSALEGVLQHCSQASFKNLILDTMSVVQLNLDEMEALRADELKKLQAQEPRQILKRFFPKDQITGQKSVQSWRNSFRFKTQ